MGASVGSPLEQFRCVRGGRQTASASGHRETAGTLPGARGTLQMGTFRFSRGKPTVFGTRSSPSVLGNSIHLGSD